MNHAKRLGWERIVELALDEDIGTGDVTSEATIAADSVASATMLVKSDGVISGLEVAAYVFQRVDASTIFTPLVANGARVTNRTPIAQLSGNARSILLAERVALNLIQRLSGVATLTKQFVDTIAGTNARIVDTRKTTPGMRLLEKRAVEHGGGHNHRFGLADGVLIKDNHLAAVGGPDRVARAVRLARQQAPHTLRVEIEITTLPELQEALEAGADVIMLDNMNLEQMRQAVRLTAGRALLEASGGITLQTVRAVAETGVDLISSGALTHSAPALDISLDFHLD